MSGPQGPKKKTKIHFGDLTNTQPADLPIQQQQGNLQQQQGGMSGQVQQMNSIPQVNPQQQQFVNQQLIIQPPNNQVFQQRSISPISSVGNQYFPSNNSQSSNPPLNRFNNNPQPVELKQNQIQPNISNQIQPSTQNQFQPVIQNQFQPNIIQNQIQPNLNQNQYQPPIQKEEKKQEQWIQPKPNTPLEERELKFQSKNRQEINKYFKGYVESSKNSSKQSCSMDLPMQITKTKEFFLKQQPLAIKVQQFMEKYLFYQENQSQVSFGNFLQKNYIIGDKSVDLPQNLYQQLNDNSQRPKEILLTQKYGNSRDDILFLSNVNNLGSFLEQSKTISSLSKAFTYDQLPLLSKFIYRHFILKIPCCLQVDNSDFYLFQSCQGSPNDSILLQLLLQTLKNENKLQEMITQSEQIYFSDPKEIKFNEIEKFIKDLQINSTFTIKVQLSIKNLPNTNQKLSDKYNQLWELYSKGCKSQIFKKLLESSWPERSFQQAFDQTFNMVAQFQLVIIWLKQMQEKIMDFQLFARACLGLSQESQGEIQNNISTYIEQFKTELNSLIFRQIATQLYCVATTFTNKDISQQTRPVFQIFFSKDQQAQLLLGDIVCQKTNSSLCFYFKDQNDNNTLKQVSVQFDQGRGQALGNCDANFLVDSKPDKQYNFFVFDSRDAMKKYSEFGRLFDTVLINRLIEKTRQPRDNQTNFDVYDLLFPK